MWQKKNYHYLVIISGLYCVSVSALGTGQGDKWNQITLITAVTLLLVELETKVHPKRFVDLEMAPTRVESAY